MNPKYGPKGGEWECEGIGVTEVRDKLLKAWHPSYP